MKNRALWLAPALAFAMGGCETKTPPAPPKPVSAPAKSPAPGVGIQTVLDPEALRLSVTKKCDEVSVKCDLEVTVASCAADGSGISVDHPRLGVDAKARNVQIRWTIKTAGYKFATDTGIAFKSGTWQDEFHSKAPGGQKYSWEDRNNLATGPRAYDYSITIVKDDGSPCATKDPTIINDA